MTTLTRKTAAVAAIAALALTGATGVAHAEINLGSVTFFPTEGGKGSVDTSGSLLGEPTTGSLAPVASEVMGSVGVNSVDPAPGTGSVDTTGSLLGEPTTGSLAPVAGSVAGSLGSGSGSGDTGSLGPVLVVGGLAAVIALGVTFAPQIEQALADAGIQLPPMP